MSVPLLIKKLYLDERNIVTRDILKAYCTRLRLRYNSTIRYLISNKYLHRILRGIFYLPSIEERKLGRLDINYMDAIARALTIKGVKNWYFGLETAMRLNALTHEFFTTDFVVSDTLFRARAITILGHKVKFTTLKKSLFGFGIIKKRVRFSSPEKTVLDIIYLSRYNGLADREIENRIGNAAAHCAKNTLLTYAKKYNTATELFVRERL
jgi:predicted transcriptional regulator of viral defense system